MQSDWKANAFYNGSQIEERGDRKGQPEAADWPQSSGVTGRQDDGERRRLLLFIDWVPESGTFRASISFNVKIDASGAAFSSVADACLSVLSIWRGALEETLSSIAASVKLSYSSRYS